MGTNLGTSQSSRFLQMSKNEVAPARPGGGKPGFSARSLDGLGERGDLSRGQENPGSLDC